MKPFCEFTSAKDPSGISFCEYARRRPPLFAGDAYEGDWEAVAPRFLKVPCCNTTPNDWSTPMLNPAPKPGSTLASHSFESVPVQKKPRIPIVLLGTSLGAFLSLTFVLCVLFDLWFPAYAMNSVWAPLLPGFTWISWPSVLLGLVETFFYGWYFALIFGGLYNFMLHRADARQPG